MTNIIPTGQKYITHWAQRVESFATRPEGLISGGEFQAFLPLWVITRVTLAEFIGAAWSGCDCMWNRKTGVSGWHLKYSDYLYSEYLLEKGLHIEAPRWLLNCTESEW